MERIGSDIVRMEELINTPMVPAPDWARRWQAEAEHVLFLAHMAKDANDLDQLLFLDAEALRLVEQRASRLARKK